MGDAIDRFTERIDADGFQCVHLDHYRGAFTPGEVDVPPATNGEAYSEPTPESRLRSASGLPVAALMTVNTSVLA